MPVHVNPLGVLFPKENVFMSRNYPGAKIEPDSFFAPGSTIYFRRANSDEILTGLVVFEFTHNNTRSVLINIPPDSFYVRDLRDLLSSDEENKIFREQRRLKKESIDCPICLEPLDRDFTSAFTKCEHRFHKQCIERWQSGCPYCRQDMGKILIFQRRKRKGSKRRRRLRSRSTKRRRLNQRR